MQQGDAASLEEILASIKVMMARDDAQRLARSGPFASEAEPADEDEAGDVLDLAETDMVAQSEAEPAQEQKRAVENPAGQPLTSSATAQAIRDSLAALRAMGRSGEAAEIEGLSPASLETLARAMLRPMLAGWLEANLPAIVERQVQAEIERILRPPS